MFSSICISCCSLHTRYHDDVRTTNCVQQVNQLWAAKPEQWTRTFTSRHVVESVCGSSRGAPSVSKCTQCTSLLKNSLFLMFINPSFYCNMGQNPQCILLVGLVSHIHHFCIFMSFCRSSYADCRGLWDCRCLWQIQSGHQRCQHPQFNSSDVRHFLNIQPNEGLNC